MVRLPPTAALLPIGDEVLRGETLDSNSAFLAAELTARGVQVRRILTLPDELDTIVVELQAALAAHDFVITTGGIGPTPDDMTREAVALALGVELELNREAAEAYSAKLGRELNPGQLEMCRLPRGCRLIRNDSVGPPGCVAGRVYVLPGVPSIMKAMWATICDEFSGPQEFRLSFKAGVPESRFSPLMRELGERYPQVKIGSYPRQIEGGWEVEIRLHGYDEEQLARLQAEFEAGLALLRG
ncbi:competence/damage-inducible protein A [bacterium]|nr:competence/damage-inducible protein A [bacterium]